MDTKTPCFMERHNKGQLAWWHSSPRMASDLSLHGWPFEIALASRFQGPWKAHVAGTRWLFNKLYTFSSQLDYISHCPS